MDLSLQDVTIRLEAPCNTPSSGNLLLNFSRQLAVKSFFYQGITSPFGFISNLSFIARISRFFVDKCRRSG